MSVTITIPDAVAGAIRIPEAHLQERLCEELAVMLYADGALSFGKARELAGVGSAAESAAEQNGLHSAVVASDWK